MRKLLLLLSLFIGLSNYAQNTDTLKVLSYNLLNFPGTTPNRVDTLKGILNHIKPDIFMVCEITSGVGADDILFNALNVDGETSYEMSTWENGPNTENMLYYNSDKLGLKEENIIPTALRNIDEYVLYYKSDDIATTDDTTFFYVYVCHLKASQGFEAERDAEAQVLKDYIATRPGRENILIGGDFNFYGSTIEPAWNTILNNGATIVDPINLPGDWHVNAGYASIHTQSTRTSSFGGGATGGMDDRFDFIFMSPDLNSYGNDAKYLAGTYRAVGQDGLHYNDALIDSPWNTSEPAPVIWNLYNMSDHLPIYMEIEVQKETNTVVEKEKLFNAFYVADSNQIKFEIEEGKIEGQLFIYDLGGKLIKTFDSIDNDNSVSTAFLTKGMYVLKMEKYDYSLKFVVE